MKKSLLLLLLLSSSAFAQEVPQYAVPIGKGPGVVGFGSALPGTIGNVLTSNGGSVDPSFQVLPAYPTVPGFSTVSQYYAGASSSTIIPPAIIYPTETTTVYAATTTFDFATFINTNVTLTGNISTMTLTNVTAGKAGTITFTQSGAGSYTVPANWNAIFKFAGGVMPALTTGSATAVDVLTYSCRSATFCAASLLKDARNP